MGADADVTSRAEAWIETSPNSRTVKNAGGGAFVAQDGLPTLGSRLLGKAVDEAAGGAAAVEYGPRPFQNPDLLDVRQVAEMEGVVAHAIDEDVTISDIAPDHELIALALSDGPADSGHVLDRIRQGQGPLIVHHLGGDDVDRLRDVAQCRVDLQRRGVASAIFRLRGRYHDDAMAGVPSRPAPVHAGEGGGAIAVEV